MTVVRTLVGRAGLSVRLRTVGMSAMINAAVAPAKTTSCQCTVPPDIVQTVLILLGSFAALVERWLHSDKAFAGPVRQTCLPSEPGGWKPVATRVGTDRRAAD